MDGNGFAPTKLLFVFSLYAVFICYSNSIEPPEMPSDLVITEY